MKYHIATNDQAMKTKQSATGMRSSHLSQVLSVSVNFQIRAAEPENDVGADITTRSEASLSLILLSRAFLRIQLSEFGCHGWVLSGYAFDG
jgi:hypothetical protein